jgi:hypothetical protein
MSLVYDHAPEITYDPARIPDREYTRPQPGDGTPAPRPQPGFGGIAPRRMLEHGAPPKHPWLTVSLAEQELAIGEYQRQPGQVALDSMREGWDE